MNKLFHVLFHCTVVLLNSTFPLGTIHYSLQRKLSWDTPKYQELEDALHDFYDQQQQLNDIRHDCQKYHNDRNQSIWRNINLFALHY